MYHGRGLMLILGGLGVCNSRFRLCSSGRNPAVHLRQRTANCLIHVGRLAAPVAREEHAADGLSGGAAEGALQAVPFAPDQKQAVG